MADELTNVAGANAVPDGQTEQEAQATSQEQAKKVNLFELEDFRKWQAAQDRRAAEILRQNQALAEEVRTLRMQGMSDQERLVYDLQQKEAELNELKRSIEEEQYKRQMEDVKRRDVQVLSDLSGVPFEKLMAAENYDAAMKMAHEHALKQRKAAERGVEEPTYIPRGSPTAPATRQMIDAKTALGKGDTMAYFEAILGS